MTTETRYILTERDKQELLYRRAGHRAGVIKLEALNAPVSIVQQRLDCIAGIDRRLRDGYAMYSRLSFWNRLYLRLVFSLEDASRFVRYTGFYYGCPCGLIGGWSWRFRRAPDICDKCGGRVGLRWGDRVHLRKRKPTISSL